MWLREGSNAIAAGPWPRVNNDSARGGTRPKRITSESLTRQRIRFRSLRDIVGCFACRHNGVMSWSARQYVAFEEERTRPVRDLLSAIPRDRAERAIDLGCGPGNSTEVLISRFPDAVVSGLDSPPDMIEAARRRTPA